MPISSDSNKKPVMDLLKRFRSKYILELGVGYGHFGPKIRIEIPGSYLVGIEIFKPYFEKIPTVCYKELYNEDIRNFPYEDLCNRVPIQAVMLIDVLEHLNREDGEKLLKRLEDLIQVIIVSVPIIDYPQDSFMGNEWEEHKTQWKIEELEKLGFTLDFKDELIGVFYKIKEI
jgi:hypothetical protein